jgi:hypothetical protein
MPALPPSSYETLPIFALPAPYPKEAGLKRASSSTIGDRNIGTVRVGSLLLVLLGLFFFSYMAHE